MKPAPPPPAFSDSVFHVTWKDDFVGARRPNWVLTGQGTYTQNAERGGSGTLTYYRSISLAGIWPFLLHDDGRLN